MPPQRLYFSIGRKEDRTRNPLLQPGRANTEAIAAAFAGRGVQTKFELNPGTHFTDPAARTAAGLAWLLGVLSVRFTKLLHTFPPGMVAGPAALCYNKSREASHLRRGAFSGGYRVGPFSGAFQFSPPFKWREPLGGNLWKPT